MMKNPIGKCNMFATPDSMKALENWLALHHGEEAIHVMTGAMMAWNLASKLVDEALENETEELK